MDIALWGVAGLAVLLGLAGMVLPLLPGTPLLFGGLWLAAWIEGYAKVGGMTVAALGAMALIAWAVDYVAAIFGVRRVGASRRAMVGAGIGAVAGLFAGLPGLVLGPIVGAMTGEWIARRDGVQATRAGVAAGVGFIVAMAAKLGIGVAMIGVFASAYLI